MPFPCPAAHLCYNRLKHPTTTTVLPVHPDLIQGGTYSPSRSSLEMLRTWACGKGAYFLCPCLKARKRIKTSRKSSGLDSASTGLKTMSSSEDIFNQARWLLHNHRNNRSSMSFSSVFHLNLCNPKSSTPQNNQSVNQVEAIFTVPLVVAADITRADSSGACPLRQKELRRV